MFLSTGFLGLLFTTSATAQTWTKCQPLNVTCSPDPALSTTYNVSYDRSSTELGGQYWNVSGEKLISFGSNGADLTLFKTGQSITAQSNFYIFWGTVEIIMRAAKGQGIISTIVLLSDDLDEVDLEIIGSNHTTVETNWYGHGNESQTNAHYHPVDGPQDQFHNYTIVWAADKLVWYVDGRDVRTLPYARSGLYPQTPSLISFGVWAAGDKGAPPGRMEWAGGQVDWSQGPFTMSVQSIKITDGSTNVTTYSYGDHSGTHESIQLAPGVSKAYQAIHRQSSSQKAAASWKGLSTAAKVGILCGVLGGLAACTVLFCIFCFRQRKRGRAERMAADQAWNQQQSELLEHRNRLARERLAARVTPYGEKF